MLAIVVHSDVGTAWKWAELLASERITCEIVPSGSEALDHAGALEYDVVVAASHVGDMTAVELAQRCSHLSRPLPLVMWAQTSAPDVIADAFTEGIADVCNSGAHICEVAARLGQAVARSRSSPPAKLQLKKGNSIDLETGDVLIEGECVRLTTKEAAILAALVEAGGRVLSKQVIVTAVYGHLDQPSLKTVDVFICKIRKAFGDLVLIETVWGRGYRFVAEWA